MKYNTLQNLKWILKESWKEDKLLFLYILIFSICNSIQTLLLIVLPKIVLDDIQNHKTQNQVLSDILVLLSIYLICFVLVRVSDNMSWPRYIIVRMKIKKRAADKFMSMKQADIENPKVLDLCERANQASSYNENGFEGMFRRSVKITSKIGAFVGCISIIGIINIWLIIMVIAGVGIYFVFNTRARQFEKKVSDELLIHERKRDYIFNTMYNFKNGKDVRLYDMSQWLVNAFRKVSAYRREKLKDVESKKKDANIIGNIMNILVELSLYIFLINTVVNKGMSIGDFTMSVSAVRTLFSTLNMSLDDIAHIRQQSLIVNDLIGFINLEDDDYVSKNKGILDLTQTYKIEFKNVSFSYPGSEKYALRNISLVIEKGEKLGVVGLNGSGKTTMIKLLTKLYEPQSGKILINDIDITDIPREDYYKMFSVVFQEIYMFAFSILQNTSMRKESATDKELALDCLREAGLYEKINKLEKGIDTKLLKIIDEEGIELSGGESQKLAMARALYRDAPYLILDEPTSALDALAEKKIYSIFNEMIADKTAIFISHRLSSTKFCDKIAMFEYGDLIEYGTHDELLNKKGKYYDMFEVQAKYYRDKEVTYGEC
ncbi:ABC transporter ATP-binding protein [Clostridium cellulovorans]|uniref:ABC transporter related n=1 Tax=Clostridium cellulovorans (strain ATCC 35296 / DSM 3052 / OCM 3 / 743B) TaxID=573061 RepID=D9STS5_CLOC7|nr:ABC transporter ATP-binding protein [Clostridium cellulovorans]ADL52809.1 ABC transporter related [Clostridium cellulovorans 743B]